jgi:cysteine desulfurase
LRDRLLAGLSHIDGVYLNGDLARRVPHNLNASFGGVDGEALLLALDDIALSSGSACTSASLEPSHVLRALGRGDELAAASIRFSLGRFTTGEEIDYTIERVTREVARLREQSPHGVVDEAERHAPWLTPVPRGRDAVHPSQEAIPLPGPST